MNRRRKRPPGPPVVGERDLKYSRTWRCNDCGLLHDRSPDKCDLPRCDNGALFSGGAGFTMFHSRGEAYRFAELDLMQKAGHIADLKTQISFDLKAEGGQLVGRYVADFTYVDRDGWEVVEDFKGAITALSKWKMKHVQAQYGITILITRG